MASTIKTINKIIHALHKYNTNHTWHPLHKQHKLDDSQKCTYAMWCCILFSHKHVVLENICKRSLGGHVVTNLHDSINTFSRDQIVGSASGLLSLTRILQPMDQHKLHKDSKLDTLRIKSYSNSFMPSPIKLHHILRLKNNALLRWMSQTFKH